MQQLLVVTVVLDVQSKNLDETLVVLVDELLIGELDVVCKRVSVCL